MGESIVTRSAASSDGALNPLSFLLNSFVYASMLFLISSGLTLIFGVLGILNMAHGALYMIGAYIAYTLITSLYSSSHLSAYLMIPVVGLIVGGIGMLIERSLIHRVYDREDVYQLLLTFGIALAFDDIVRMIWGSTPRSAGELYMEVGTIDVGGSTYPLYNFIVIAVAVIYAIVLWYLLFKTRNGRIIRAMASNKELAQAIGIKRDRLFTLTFGLGAMLAGLGGAIMLPATSATLGMGTEVIVEAFAVVAIGGLGSVKGAALGALIVSFLRNLGITYFPEVELAILYLITAGILLLRPRGLFGEGG